MKAAYPKIRIVLGGLDDSGILTEEASKADLVLRPSMISSEHTAHADRETQTPQMLQTTLEQRRRSSKGWPSTPKTIQVSGCIPVAQAY